MIDRLLLMHILLRHGLRLSILRGRHDPKSSLRLTLSLLWEGVFGTASKGRCKVRSRSLNSCTLRRGRTEVLRWIRVGRVRWLRLRLDWTIYPLRGRRGACGVGWGIGLAWRIVQGCGGLRILTSGVARSAAWGNIGPSVRRVVWGRIELGVVNW
jgi:hypothetical protein